MEFSDLVGKTILSIERRDMGGGSEALFFRVNDGITYCMRHEQDCCESVYIEDVVGDFEDLLNTPVLYASEDTNSDQPNEDEYPDTSWTWTFYNISTIKGHVTIRWYGSSNGYYSEGVSFYDASKSSSWD